MLVFILCLFCFLAGAPAARPHLVKHVHHKGGEWCHNDLILSSDAHFFYAGGCEDDIALTRGTWTINNHRLILTEFDSAVCFPNARVTYQLFRTRDSVRITCTDYFGAPFTFSGLFRYDTGGHEIWEWFGADGSVLLSRQQCMAFRPAYLNPGTGRPAGYQTIKTDSNDIHVSLDYPVQAGLDRPVFVHHFGLISSYIWQDSLLLHEDSLIAYRQEQ